MENELKKIDILKERANVTYEEARIALEEADGNLVEALIKLEKEDRIRPKQKPQQARSERKERREHPHQAERQAHRDHRREEMRDAGDKLKKHRFVLHKDNQVFLDIPTWVALLVILVTMPFSLFALLLAIIVGYQMQIRSYTGKKYSVDQPIREVAQQVKDGLEKEKDDDEADQ
jgi:Flp pilus assembly protein TadB